MANFPTIRVTEGNEFSLLLPLKRRTFESCRPIDEDIDAMELTDLVVKFGGVVYQPSVDESGVTIILPGTLARGTYDIVLTAKYQGSDIRAAYESAVSIVPWNSQSDAQQYVPGSPIVLESAYIIGGTLTDEELEQLKQDLREAIWSADQAREAAERAEQDFIDQAEQLSGTAQETTLTDGIQTLSDKIDNIDVDTSGLAQQGSNDSATLTDTQAYASSAATDAAYIRNGLDAAFPTLAKETSVKDGNDTAISVSKGIASEMGTSSDTAAETGTLSAVVKWIKDKVKSIGTDYAKQGSNANATLTDTQQATYAAADGVSDLVTKVGTPGSGQPSTLFAAIAAGGGGGGDAQESTSQEILSRIGSAGSGQSATLFGAIGDVALSATTLQSLADSWAAMVTNRASLDGYTLVAPNVLNSAGEILLRKNLLYSIHDTDTKSCTLSGAFSGCSNLVSVEFESLEEISIGIATIATFMSCTSLGVVKLPSLVRLTNANNNYANQMFYNSSATEIYMPLLSVCPNSREMFSGCTQLKILDISSLVSFGYAFSLAYCARLIDLRLAAFTTSFDISSWSPTNALDANSQTLLTAEDIAAGFTSNLEKLLYNIREHIAANLPVANNTITLSAAVKAAIQADTATSNAFTNKGWTIA